MLMPELKKWDAVRIHWQDSSGLAGEWQKPSDRDMSILGCVTVGQVYKVHKDRITVVCSWDTVHKNAHGGITIPVSDIHNVEVLS